MFTKILVVFIGTVIFSCVGELQTLHLTDFIEFYSSLSKCKNADLVTRTQQAQYYDCLEKNLPKPPASGDNGYNEFYSRVCLNEDAYGKCWEPVIRKSKECNSANGKGHPTSFKMVTKAICKNDQGRSFTDAMGKAMIASRNEMREVPEGCGTGEHWMDACKDLEIDARDVCKKHSALNTCIERIICNKISMGRLFLDVYREAGKLEGCVVQNTTAKSTIDKNQSHRRGHKSKAQV